MRRLASSFAQGAVFTLLLAPTAVWGQQVFGPLAGSEQNPLYRTLYVMEMEGADVLPPGVWRAGLATQYSSVFEDGGDHGSRQIFDLERMANVLSVRRGMGGSVEVGGSVMLSTHWEGFLDPFVIGFHDFFGISNGGREDHPEDHYRFELARTEGGGDGVDLELRDRAFALEDVRLYGKWSFVGAPDEQHAISARVEARVAGVPFEAGRLSGGASLMGRFSRNRTHVHLQLGLAVLNPPAELRSITRKRAIFFAHGIERELSPGLSFLAQLSGNTPYFDGFQGADLHGVPMTLTVGLGGRAGSVWEWKVGFAEDILFGGPSVDFTVGFEIARSFGAVRGGEAGAHPGGTVPTG